MGLYQLYFLDDDDRDIARQEHRCADDRAAVRRGRSLCMEHNIDIWDNARRVARIRKEQFRAAPRIAGLKGIGALENPYIPPEQ